MTISSRMRALMQMEGHEFVTAVYRELLNREPNPEGLHAHLVMLHSGVPKMSVMLGILFSQEADELYDRG